MTPSLHQVLEEPSNQQLLSPSILSHQEITTPSLFSESNTLIQTSSPETNASRGHDLFSSDKIYSSSCNSFSPKSDKVHSFLVSIIVHY